MIHSRELFLFVILFSAFGVLNHFSGSMGLASVVFAADNYQPMNVNTGLWQVTHTSNLGGSRHAGSYKTCVTSKDLQTNPWRKGDQEGCDWKMNKSTPSDMEMHGSSCDAGKEYGMQTEVDLKIHAVDPSTVTATMQGTSTGNGQEVNFSGTFNGKWVSASCPTEIK